MTESKKLPIAWYSFACCEDSTIIFTEILNDYFFEFKSRFDLIDAPILNANRDQVSPLAIAFIEGAANSPDHVEQIKAIRARAKLVVAIGSCACTGMPSGYRNQFTPDQTQEISFILEKFNFSDNVQKLEDIINVDAKVPGCPMGPSSFLDTVNSLLIKVGYNPIPLKV